MPVRAISRLAVRWQGMTLTVLNQSGTGYARRYGAPIGTVTGMCRSVYAIFFGIAPAVSIGIYSAVPWLPLALMAAVSVLAAATFALMKASGASDPVPPTQRVTRSASADVVAVQTPNST